MKKILVVDDEKRIRDIYIRLLVESGFIVRQAASAQEATNILIREPIELVLLDIKIPKINGKEIFEILKEYNPRIKVIIASVYPIEKQKQVIPQATDYYDKSHGPFMLLDKIANVLV